MLVGRVSGLRIDAKHIVEAAGVKGKAETLAAELHPGRVIGIGIVREDQAFFAGDAPITAEAAEKKAGPLVARQQIAGLGAAVDPLAGVPEKGWIGFKVLIEDRLLRQDEPGGSELALELAAGLAPLVIAVGQAAKETLRSEIAIARALVLVDAVIAGDLFDQQPQPVLLPGGQAAAGAVEGGLADLQRCIGLGEDEGQLHPPGVDGIGDIGRQRRGVEPGRGLLLGISAA